MTEERKRDIQSMISAGKKVIAKLKKYHDDKIISYDGQDAFYSDEAEYLNEVENIQAEETFDEAQKSEKAFGYYEKIMSKLENVKDSIKGNDSMSEFLKKAESFFKNSNVLTKEQLETELDALMVELEDKITVIGEKSAETTASIDALTEQSRSNYQNLSTSVGEVADKADEMLKTLSEVSAILNSSTPKIEEIREAAIGIDKLTDSIFELKNTNISVKNEIEAINKRINFMKVFGITAASVGLVLALTALVLVIL